MKRFISGRNMTVVGLLALTSAVYAQEPAAPAAPSAAPEAPATPPPSPAPKAPAAKNQTKDKDKVEKISVTGSRIKRQDMTGSSPLTIIGREEIANTGAQTVTDIVKDLPAAIGNSTTTSTTNGGGGGSGNIALRGLDSSSTLVLLNGRRLPVDAAGSSPDLNSIPVAAIERVEVLQDGASAIYGSDAIAGVINIITRKEYEGLGVETYYGQASRGDLETKGLDVTFGSVSDRASLMFGFSHYSQGKIASRDRDVSRNILSPSPTTPQAKVSIDGQDPLIVKDDFTGTKPSPSDYRPVEDGDTFNFSQITDAVMAQDRNSIFLSGSYELKPDLKTFFEATVARTESEYNAAPTPVSISQETGNITISPNNPYNSFGVELTKVRKRLLELGPRVSSSESLTSRIVAGFEGKLDNTWSWDFAYNRGLSRVQSQTENIVNKTNLMIGLGDPAACTKLAALGCVPINLLGPAGSIDSAQADWLRLTARDQTAADVESLVFNASGDLVQTPLGMIALAAGVEVRGEKFDFKADSNSEKYNTVGSTNGKSTKGDRDVKEAYVELSVPLTKLAELELAGRYSDYSDFGSTTNPKFGLKIYPVEGLIVRGTYSTGFRAPSLVELYRGQQENFAQLKDPCQANDLPGYCNGVQADKSVKQFLVLQGGNPNLKPEKSKAFTFGLAYSFANIFNAKADYFEIKTENAIDTNGQFILDQFRTSGKFTDKVELDASNNIKRLEAIALNLSARKVRGVDLGTDYTLVTTGAGRYTFSILGSHYIEYLNQADATAPFVNVVGVYSDAASGGRGSIPKWKGVGGVDWRDKAITAGISANYESKLNAEGADIPKIPAWTTYDLRVGYSFADYGDVTLGINNIADAKPPRTDAAGNDNIDARTHNLIGRFYYARYGFKI